MKNPPKKKFSPKEYEYVGPKEILQMIKAKYRGTVIEESEEIRNWIGANHKNTKFGDVAICTFTINLQGKLVIADRHSEHVQCAFGEKVRSAGEIGFVVEKKNEVYVDSITNQSTGYCPSSESWFEVEKALKAILQLKGLSEFKGFDPAFIFSYCPDCKTRQIVKDEFYFCLKCEEELLSEGEFQMKRGGLEFR
ncbi:MAG: hypothetical protein ACPG49_05085 [Chitinophagales bacterium]